jgi:cysteine-rich repeat protein
MCSHQAGVRSKLERAAVLLSLAVSTIACSNESGLRRPAAEETLREPSVLAPGFQENLLLQGHVNPVGIRFVSAPGPLRAMVFEKGGKIYYYDDLSTQTTPAQAKLVADLGINTHDYWDRGMLGLAIAPNFPATPHLYVLTTLDQGNFWNDGCSDATGAGCVVSGRLSRLTLNPANPSLATTTEQPLLEARWCMQYPSHATGDLHFGDDGYLYASSGDGASFNFLDWGQVDGLVQGVLTKNACNDPGGLDAQGRLVLATSEGGQLRSQDLQTGGDATNYNGTILRMDVSGSLPVAPPTNPLVGKGTTNDDFIIATGLRNPYRFNVRRGTNEIWIADVGEGTYEELDRIADPGGSLENFGWPCFEGPDARFNGNALCDQVKAGAFAPSVSPQALVQPYFTYRHDQLVAPGDGCGTGGSSITGVAFNDKNVYPASYDGALFFADSTRRCVWSMRRGANGQPDATTRAPLVQGAAGRVVDLQMAANGRLYYVDFDGGKVFRIDNFAGNQPPQAVVTATPSNGPAPLQVQLSAAQSTDAENDALSFAWDLDGDGVYDDAQGPQPLITFVDPGLVNVSVLVTDTSNNSDTASVTLSVDNSAPVPTISSPQAGLSWSNGDVINFAGGASDAEDGSLGGSSLSWQLVMRHCASEPIPGTPEDCHDHPIQTFSGASGSFVAPDHTYYSYLLLRLTATDAAGLAVTTSVRLEPRAVQLHITSQPAGLRARIGEAPPVTTPTAAIKVLRNGQTTIAVDSPQVLGGRIYQFVSWSNGAQAVHVLQPTADTTLHAVFADAGQAPLCESVPLAVVGSAASSTESAETPASEAFDGINTQVCGVGGNRWSSQFSDPQWLYADLGADRHLSQVVLHWECAFASAFDVQVAPNGADPTNSAAYTTVYSTSNATGGSQTVGGLNTVGRYVRVYTRARGTAWGASLFEVELRGDPDPACTSSAGACGNSVVEAGEACDDGNAVNTDACTNACALPSCGDTICSASESCSSCASDCGTCSGRSIASNLEAETFDAMLGLQYEATTDVGGGQNAGWIAAGDYVQWNINVPTTGSYTVTSRSATWAATSLQVVLDGTVAATLSLPATYTGAGSQYQTWGSFTSSAFNMTAGLHTLRVAFTGANQNLNWIKVNTVGMPVCGNGALETGEACDDGNTTNTDACTNACAAARCGDAIVRTGVEACDDGNTTNTDACTNACAAARCGDAIVRTGVEACDDGNTTNTDACTNACSVPACGDTICSASESCSSCASDCGPCAGRSIASNLEAETYDGMLGLQYENTADVGGGQNAGWIAAGDYVQWNISVPTTGSYTVTTRSATWAATGLQVLVDGAVAATLNLPATYTGTGSRTQTWVSFASSAFNLTAGVHTLRIAFTSGNQNLNWIRVSPASAEPLLGNAAFNTDLAGWISYFMAPVGTAVWETGSARIAPASSGTDWWAQFFQSRTVAAGNYSLSVSAQAVSGTKTIAVFCEQDGGAFTGYGQATCNLTTAWSTCSVTCNNVPGTTPTKFGVKGGLSLTAFRIDNFVLTKL